MTSDIGHVGVDLGLLLLRVVTGLTLMAHGYQKIFLGGRIAGTARWFDSIGMRPGRVHAIAAAGTELTAGLMLVAGFLSPLAGAALIGVMVVAAHTVHREHGFFIVRNGWEYNLVLAVVGGTVALAGPGRFSLDRVMGLDTALSGWVGAAIVVGGVLAGVLQLVLFFRPPIDVARS
jgi:putative oxidoreductase